MSKFILKRLLLTIVVLIGVSFIVFTILSLIPGSPGRSILGMDASQAEVDAFNHKYGYDQPFLIRYIDYIKNIVTKFDFGESYQTQKPVFTDILSRFPVTFKLVLISTILSSIIGIVLGVVSAVKHYHLIDTVSTVSAMIFAATPSFWLGMILISFFALRLRILPSNGIDSWKGYIMPIAVTVITGAAGNLRMTRSSMLLTLRQDYVRTARAKGANEGIVIFKHALRNALMPVVTTIGVNFGMQLGSTVVVETLFSIPGLGSLIVYAIRNKDIPQVMASVIFLASLFSMIMLIVDLLYAFIDPRIKAKYMRG